MSDTEIVVNSINAHIDRLMAENAIMRRMLKSIAHGDYTGHEAKVAAEQTLIAIKLNGANNNMPEASP